MQDNASCAAWPVGVKRTKPREQVISVLEQATTPLTAMDICKQIELSQNAVWLSTVYRVLDLFTAKGLLVKTAILDNGMALYELNRHDHTHYAVCLSCHRVIAMENCPMEEYCPKLKESGFHVMGHKLEMYGYCEDCEKNATKSAHNKG